MVNSKKMSKSSIAVIVLAILLVLSMVLGLTGAWYTAKSDPTSGGTGGSVSLRDGWMTLSLRAGENDGAVQVYRGAAETTAQKIDSDMAMPGDYVNVTTSTFTATATVVGTESGATAYIFLIDKDKKVVDQKEITAGGTAEFTAIKADLAEGNKLTAVEDKDGWYKINEDLGYTEELQTVATFTVGSYSVVAIQTENIADENTAKAELVKLGFIAA